MDVTSEEQRAFIKIQFLRNLKPPEIHANLVEACGEAAFGLRNVQKWFKRFEEGSRDTNDAARSGRPISATDLDHVQEVEELLLDDRRWTCEELSEKLDISPASVFRILTKDLGMQKVAARWVPHNLTPQQKQERVRISRLLLRRSRREDEFLERIIAIDETWVRSYEPELKRQSAEWRRPGSPRPVKFRQKPSSVKLMLIAAYDSKGIVLSHFVPSGQTVNAAYYCNYLSQHLRSAIRRKRPQLQAPLILQDNAAPHRARITQDALEQLQWECLPHPPYSPDLSPPDFELFSRLKEPLRGQRFQSLEEVKSAARRVLNTINRESVLEGIQKLPHRWNRVIELEGEYIEG